MELTAKDLLSFDFFYHKRCKTCGEWKTLDQFSRAKHMPDKRHTECKSCKSIRGKKLYHSDLEKYRKVGRERNMKHRNGILPDEYNAMLEKQDGGCAICGKKPNGKRRFSVDHDHETGIIRGLLCDKCNVTLGLMEDSIERLSKAILYLSKFKEA